MLGIFASFFFLVRNYLKKMQEYKQHAEQLEDLSGLTCADTVCIGYQQTINVARMEFKYN